MAFVKKGDAPKPKAGDPSKLKGGGKGDKGGKAPPIGKIKGGGKPC